MLRTVLLVLSAVCFGVNAFRSQPGKINLDAAGKCLFVASMLCH